MKNSLMWFLRYILTDVGMWCGVDTSRDWKTILERVEHEGSSFLTITLASFGKDFERSLELGEVAPNLFSSFKKRGRLPVLLSGFLEQVFSRESGVLLDEPDTLAIWAIRQITLSMAKIEAQCSPARENAAINGYIQTELELDLEKGTVAAINWQRFRRIAFLLFGDILGYADHKIATFDVRPKHGPGATADRLMGNQKWNLREWTSRMEGIFPIGEYLLPNWRYHDRQDLVEVLDPGSETPVRLVSVPKTQSSPRIIAIEPTCMQYMQQGLLRLFEERIEADKQLAKICSWNSSELNHNLAKSGSRSGGFATLDLKEASDRVTCEHVWNLVNAGFGGSVQDREDLTEAIFAVRSTHAAVPGWGKTPLTKYASMGSALTFPLEVMVFTTILFCGIEQELGHQLTRHQMRSMASQVRVFGDDLICRTRYAPSVIHCLEEFNFKVNEHKSFWKGKFRESCGAEFYAGEDVTIARMKHELPTHRLDGQAVIGLIELRNRCYHYGLWATAQACDDIIAGLNIPFPNVDHNSPIFGRHSSLGYQAERWNHELQRPEVRGVVASNRIPSNALDDIGALMKILSTSGEMPIPDDKHLSRSGRPRTVSIKIRYSTPY